MNKPVMQFDSYVDKRGLLYRIFLKITVFVVTYGGALFVRRPRNEVEPDTTWEKSRKDILSYGIEYWVNLIRQLGQCDLDQRVLEVGSGDGQWLVAFTQCAREVVGIEPGNETFPLTLQTLDEYRCLDKVEAMQAPAEEIPLEGQSVDLIWCIGVFMFTRHQEALSEFQRVLRPGGRLVITANGLGYFLKYVLDGIRYRSRRKTNYGLNGIYNSWYKWLTGRQLGTSAVSHAEMIKLLDTAGFDLQDTRLWLAHNKYPLEHLGFATNYAFIAVKR